MQFLGILPFLAFISAAVALTQRGCAGTIREGFVLAGVAAAAWAAIGAELLSLFKGLAFWPLLLWWGVPSVALGWMCWRGRRPRFPERPRDPILLGALAMVGLLVTLTLASGLVAAPSNWDALSYHLPRQVYWMQQQHVGFFPTNDERMLTMPPLAEYIGVQLMILSGGDYWAHTVQWLAYALCGVTVSLTAHDLGLNARWQGIAALLALSIPTAALQASNAKNDLVTAFLLCALSFSGLQIVRREKHGGQLALMLGATGGLLVLSKGTGMIFGLPLAFWIVTALWKKYGLRTTIRAGGVAVLLAAAITSGYFARVYLRSESPSARDYQTSLRNRLYTPRALLSNVLRNTAMHLATDSSRINPRLTSAVAMMHRWLGLDVNDRRTTYVGSPGYRADLELKQEDLAKAPMHVLLGFWTFGLVLARALRRREAFDGLTFSFLLLPYLSFLLFCCILAWQVWHSRLHIPVLILLCPVMAFTLGQHFPRSLLSACAIAAALGLYAAAFNTRKPWIGRSSIINRPEKRARMQPQGGVEVARAAAEVCKSRKAEVIAIAAQPNHCEYTLLRTLLREMEPDPKFLKLKLGSALAGAEPDFVVTWYLKPHQIKSLKLSDYSRVMSTNGVEVFVREKNAPTKAPGSRTIL